MNPTVEQRVAKGIEWLNHQDRLEILDEPWWDKIDLEEFSLSSPCNCVLGQLAYDLVGDSLYDNWRDLDYYDVVTMANIDPFDYGFAGEYGGALDWDELTVEWRKQILALKAG